MNDRLRAAVADRYRLERELGQRGRRFEHGVPTLLFSNASLTQDEYHRAYDITPDGKRFLMVTSGGGDSDDLRVIFNWRTELERLKDGPE